MIALSGPQSAFAEDPGEGGCRAVVRLERILASYKPSFWGRIYMYFALNPRYSFPTAEAITPEPTASREVLAVYLTKQTSLLEILDQVDHVDLSKTPIPIEKGVKFNLGDCLKVLVYHDALHIGQARGVLAVLVERTTISTA